MTDDRFFLPSSARPLHLDDFIRGVDPDQRLPAGLSFVAAHRPLLHQRPAENLTSLRFIDEAALAFIGFAAGAELHYRELRSRLKSIRWITFGLVAVTFTAVVTVVLALADWIPFIDDLGPAGKLTVALLAMRERICPPRSRSSDNTLHRYPDDFGELVERVATGAETWEEEHRREREALYEEYESEKDDPEANDVGNVSTSHFGL